MILISNSSDKLLENLRNLILLCRILLVGLVSMPTLLDVFLDLSWQGILKRGSGVGEGFTHV